MTLQAEPRADELAPAVRDAVSQIRISADRSSAVVGGREVAADFPRELRRLLAESLYNILHSGQPDGQVPTRLRDDALEQQFIARVPHRLIEVPAIARSAVQRDPSGRKRLLVEREGLRIWVPLEVITTSGIAPGEPVRLALPPWRAGLSPGFFLVDGTRRRDTSRGVQRVYLHFSDTEHAVPAWGRVLTFLEEREAPYRAKVLSSRELYPRRDSIVVYLTGARDDLVHDLAELVQDLPGLGDDTSVFVDRIAPGVGAAAEPADPKSGRQGLSFGQHRATVLAAALVEAGEDLDGRIPLVVTRFREAGIDPLNPARNLPA
jgi:hypothetical protein